MKVHGLVRIGQDLEIKQAGSTQLVEFKGYWKDNYKKDVSHES